MRLAAFLLSPALACLTTRAAPAQPPQLFVERYDDVFAFFLDGGDLNGQFDTIEFFAVPGQGEAFRYLGFGTVQMSPVSPGERRTAMNALLDLPPPFGGYGFSVLGKIIGWERIGFATGPLGQTVDTSAANPGLFLANIGVERSVHATADLYRAGNRVASLTASGVVPEPATAALAGAAGLLWALSRRRRHPHDNLPAARRRTSCVE